MPLTAPLTFVPVYKTLVWGGRRMERFRNALPAGPIGESWDLADHDAGMSIVASGPHAGRTLRELQSCSGVELVGQGFDGAAFPLMVKLIDARDDLSVQVHPDDALAQQMGLGNNGKTECWYLLESGGSLYQGTRPGVDRAEFERALAGASVASTLNRFEVSAGDFFFLEARTVHALGAGCLLYEIQQTSDVTFRVYDWGRLGLDGKPRQLHVTESLSTIDFTRTGFGPLRPAWEVAGPSGGQRRTLTDCRYFRLEEWQLERAGSLEEQWPRATCAVVVSVAGNARLVTPGGSLDLPAMTTALVPAAAERFRIESDVPVQVLVATPKLGRDAQP